MTIKADLINELIEREGGYVNDPDDSGGETNHGITVDIARANGYTGPMPEMPRNTAFDIYADIYWHDIKGDSIEQLSELVVEEVFDTSVNIGPRLSVKILQRVLTVFNLRAELYQDLAIDGYIGPKTLDALKRYLAARDEKTLLSALNALQGAYYIQLVEQHEANEKFIYGWFRNRVEA